MNEKRKGNTCIFKKNTYKRKTHTEKIYIHYKYVDVYAIYYSEESTICYNLDFNGTIQKVIFK